LRLIRYSKRSKVEILPCPSPVSFYYILQYNELLRNHIQVTLRGHQAIKLVAINNNKN
jgi:hypothetical protein